MLAKNEILDTLDSVILGGIRIGLTSKNLVQDVILKDNALRIVIADTGLKPETQETLKENIGHVLRQNKGVKTFDIVFKLVRPVDVNNVKNFIVVMSGKGGVGKSLVSGLLAASLRRKGNRVGILDADIAGPSIPRMFGLTAPLPAYGHAILPLESKTGIKVVSMNLLLENENDPVIWRGPIISNAITQFWQEALWGSLDYLIIDLPPGTTDASLTVLQSLPVTGIIIVTTPQGLVEMIVNKAVNMIKEMNKPIIGIIENMSYFQLPGTDEKTEIFGHSRAEEIAREIGVPLVGRLPIDPEIARLCDEGNIERYESTIFDTIAHNLIEYLSKTPK